jgi:Protein of unknown function (DUF2480)
MENEIVNKISESGLVIIDLEEFYPKGERILFDIKNHLFQGMILREKDFREFIKNEDWNKYQDKYVALTCSTDAIVPTWAYMLLAIHLNPVVKKVILGSLDELENLLFAENLVKLNVELYRHERVVIKGCGKLPIPNAAYVLLTDVLRPVVKSIMYGEPCSTIPLYKRKEN